ncbi:MAG: PH domain-containing protein [Algisphaera sp.]
MTTPPPSDTHPSSDEHHLAAADAEPLTNDAMHNRAGALLPRDLLQPGEIIVLLVKPSALYIALSCLKSLTLIVLLTVLGVSIARATDTHDLAQQLAIGGLVLLLARLAWQFFEWLSRVYVITDQRIITVSGVLQVRVFEAPLKQIAHSELFFSLRERLFALGTLVFSTAGTARSEAAWEMVANPLDVHAKVVKTLKRYGR